MGALKDAFLRTSKELVARCSTLRSFSHSTTAPSARSLFLRFVILPSSSFSSPSKSNRPAFISNTAASLSSPSSHLAGHSFNAQMLSGHASSLNPSDWSKLATTSCGSAQSTSKGMLERRARMSLFLGPGLRSRTFGV